MKLVVFSHKPCWPSRASPTGYASDGGFPLQMRALSELFDSTVLVLPCYGSGGSTGEMHLDGRNLTVHPIRIPARTGWRRKANALWWAVRGSRQIARLMRNADVVHAPIPGDVGTIAIVAALLHRKPLFVRYCGNWLHQSTLPTMGMRVLAETIAGGKRVVLATGGGDDPPSRRNPAVQWIFSTSLTEGEMDGFARKERRLSSRPCRLITVGRQDGSKGTEIAIDALSLLRREYPHMHLDVVGDGNALADLENRARRAGLGAGVTFHGRVRHERVLELLQAADLFCFPTVSEGFPKAVLEALANGLPVVTTPVSVLPHLIRKGRCGVVVEERTSEAVARAVAECLADPEHYRRMSARALDVARRYTLEGWRDDIGAILEKAWKGGLSATPRDGLREAAASKSGNV